VGKYQIKNHYEK